MISILVYGRNDDRGYGMHKRVALSLNALAAVIDEGTSEILFVDYNTPDHLPTLPELIRDTLTDAARRRTRVLRVRPEIHRRYSELTPLPVIEPIARNIALRRSRAQNRWILSTNTDCIVVPKMGSLIDVVRNLDSGHYVLPRYELPERVWESFDRLDAAGSIRAAAEWGRDGRLNEAVRGEGVVTFDAPGDFQLVRRADLFAMDGFDEEMLLGWHIDYNLAQRLALKLGPAQSLAASVALYHCGHARVATATHSHTRIENDVARFVHRVTAPEIPQQAGTWGCARDTIEEVSLTEPAGARLRAAAGAAAKPLGDAVIAANFDKASFDNFWYDAGHVAVHVLDLLSTYAKTSVIAYTGARRDTLAALVKGLAALGFKHRLLVPDSVADRLGAASMTELQVAPLAAVVEAADVLVFEFGLIRDEQGAARDMTSKPAITDQEGAALEAVASAFRAAVDKERQALAFGYDGRLMVTVNALHNRFDVTVATALRGTPSPFTTRLRFGTVLPAQGSADATRRPLAQEIAEITGRKTPVSLVELSDARGHLRSLLASPDVVPETRLEIAAAAPVIRALAQTERIAGKIGASGQTLLQERLTRHQAAGDELAQSGAVGTLKPERSLSGLARLDDWDRPDWLEQAKLVVASGTRGVVPRNGWIWERGQLLWAHTKLRGTAKAGRALIVCDCPEPVVAAYVGYFSEVDLIDARTLVAKEAPRLKTATDFTSGVYVSDSAVRVVTPEGLVPRRYDAIILPHASAFRGRVTGLAGLFERLRPALADTGYVALASECTLLGRVRVGRPDRNGASAAGFPAALERFAGLKVADISPMTVAKDDAALVGSPADLEKGRPVLGVWREGDIWWPAVWVFEAVPGRSVDAPNLLKELTHNLLGDQLPALLLADGVTRTGGKIVSQPGTGGGHIFFGPYLPLAPGRYRARISVERTDAAPGKTGARMVAEVGIGPTIVAQRTAELDLRRSSRPMEFDLPFTVLSTSAINWADAPSEIRLWSDGNAGITVRSVTLTTE